MICQHVAVEDLLQLFALFAVSNIPLVRFKQFCGIFLTEIRCLQCLQITSIHLKHIFVSLFAGDRLEAKVKQNVQQSNNSENYSRRNNIVLLGIVETDNETNEKM